MKTLLLYVLVLLNCSSKNYHTATNETVSGKVNKIVDGDTFDILTDKKTTIRIRMNGIDCPERKQNYYKVCKDALGSYIFGKQVQLITQGTDQYKRTIADVYVGNNYINLQMIANGYAWHYKKYSKDGVLAKAEVEARYNKLGLWQLLNPLAPWDFRNSKKH